MPSLPRPASDAPYTTPSRPLANALPHTHITLPSLSLRPPPAAASDTAAASHQECSAIVCTCIDSSTGCCSAIVRTCVDSSSQSQAASPSFPFPSCPSPDSDFNSNSDSCPVHLAASHCASCRVATAARSTCRRSWSSSAAAISSRRRARSAGPIRNPRRLRFRFKVSCSCHPPSSRTVLEANVTVRRRRRGEDVEAEVGEEASSFDSVDWCVVTWAGRRAAARCGCPRTARRGDAGRAVASATSSFVSTASTASAAARQARNASTLSVQSTGGSSFLCSFLFSISLLSLASLTSMCLSSVCFSSVSVVVKAVYNAMISLPAFVLPGRPAIPYERASGSEIPGEIPPHRMRMERLRERPSRASCVVVFIVVVVCVVIILECWLPTSRGFHSLPKTT